MAITHKFNQGFEITDYTKELMLIPNMWGLMGSQGLFRQENVGTNTVTFDKSYQTAQAVVDKPYGERTSFSGNGKTQLYTFAIPSFPLDDIVTVGDVWNQRKIGTADQRETVDAVLAKKIAQIRRSHALTREYARCKAIQGEKYAPNATISTSSWYTEFGASQKDVFFDFTNTAVDQRAKVQEVVAHIQDNFKGAGVLENIVFYCTPKFFAALISNPQIEAAYTYYSSTQEPLRNDLRFGLYRQFVWQGVTFIEYRGALPDGTAMLPESSNGTAWAVPKGADTLVEYNAPAYRLDAIGSSGTSEAYLWTYEDNHSTNIQIQSEQNFLVMNQRPELVVKCGAGAS